MTETVPHFGEVDQDLVKRLKANGYEPGIVFDVGASNGSWTWQMKSVLPDAAFYMFEPLIGHMEGYDRMMSVLQASHPHLHLHPFALGEVSGETEITVFPGELGPFGSTTLPYDYAIEGTRKIRVPVYSLADAVRRFDLPVPQLLKIDVQGSELSILKGAGHLLTEIDVLLLESWLFRGYGKHTPLLLELWQWLEARGFSLWDLGDCYRNEQDVLTAQDCLFLNRRTGLVPEPSYRSHFQAPGKSRWKRLARKLGLGNKLLQGE